VKITAATILLVKDDKKGRGQIAGALDMAGFKVLEADDQVSAQTVLASELPDLVIIDMGMPEFQGQALMHAIAEEKKWQALSLLFIADKTMAERAGFSRFGSDAALSREQLGDQAFLEEICLQATRATTLSSGDEAE
jgi:DNA-binding response OmpR family regulator